MTRIVDLVKVEGGEILNIGYDAALALGLKYDRRRGGVRVVGAGMDLGFDLVYSLSYALFGAGDGAYALKHRWL